MEESTISLRVCFTSIQLRLCKRITKRGNIILMGITALLNYDCVTLLCSVDCSANISKDFLQCTLSFDVLVLSFLLVPVNQRRSL